MKKLIILILFLVSIYGYSQDKKGLFSKNPIINLENFHKQNLYFGYFLGFNSFDYKIDYKVFGKDIETKKTIGFNVGVVADFKLHEFISLRFEPGLYFSKRNLIFPGFTRSFDAEREVNSTYIHLPILFKYLAVRTGNIRPYLVGGVSSTLNLSGKSKSKDDNLQQKFRVKSWSNNYEIGFGIDIFSEYFILSPSIRGVFGLTDELIRDNDPNSPWTSNIDSMKNRAILINFTFH